jgi:hypothetical protein
MTITFLPPMIEGTLSVGVFGTDGELVRILARDARDEDLVAGLNGFVVAWDGRDEAGVPQPAGRYLVQGYGVGAVSIEGVDFHGNDWLDSSDSPRVATVQALWLDGRRLWATALGTGGELLEVRVDLDSLAAVVAPLPPRVLEPPADSAPGPGGTLWSIETIEADGAPRSALVQRRGAETLRELMIAPGEPQPVALAAAQDRDELFLLERHAGGERVRGLRLKEIKAASGDGVAVSEWEVFFERGILAQKSFAQVAEKLGRQASAGGADFVQARLIPNELEPGTARTVRLRAGIDAEGSFLATASGLPLRRLTGTRHLRWALLAGDGAGSATLWQSDGAVVEEYRVSRLDQMMAFSAGEYGWTGVK